VSSTPTDAAAAPTNTSSSPPAVDPAPADSGVEIDEIEKVELTDQYGEDDPSSSAALAATQATKAEPEPKLDYSALPQTYHIKHVDLGLGVRVRSLTSDGLAPYLDDPVGVEAVGRLSATVVERAPVGLSVTLEASGFSRRGMARDTETRLQVVDMAAGLEGRYLLRHFLATYARLGLGAELSMMDYGCSGCDDLHAEGSNWAFLVTGSLGLAVRVLGSSDGRKRAARGWLFLEGGGNFATKHKGTLEVTDGPNRAEPVELASFSTSGGQGTLGLMVTY